MTRIFRDKIRRMVEMYIDDIVVKSKQEKGHIDDLKEVFEVLQRHKLHLNADKCAFGIGASKFLRYMITYRGIKVLTDFIAEFSSRREMEIVCHVEVQSWKVFMDGASSALGDETGIMIITPEGIKLEYSFRLGFKASNNEAEYEALLARLRVALKLGAQDMEVCPDSRLVVNQVQGSFEAKDARMIKYLELTKQTINQL
ncbi:uncharacterized protein LOC112004124 [Quercus suber]|uniref:uncharacterized protein LOC112004124 n=1 Tax=Quercus suber TaxID=58331 RepID=UPI000CE1D9E6|nr:uncharacterized protein LOC112004124 [Quercus suber]